MTDDKKRDAGAAWLTEVCDATARHALLKKPLTVTVRDEVWTIATNGSRLVGLRGEFGYPVANPDDTAKLLSVWDRPLALPSERVDLAALRAFVGCDIPAPEPKPDCATCLNTGALKCKACNGEGGEDCECEDCGDLHQKKCSECDDEGEVDCPDCNRSAPVPMRKGRIFGHLFNREILVTPLRHLPGETATWIPSDKMGMHRLDGDGWRLIVMPIRDEDVPADDAPEFSNLIPEKAAVTHD